jgi:hypothetical protein
MKLYNRVVELGGYDWVTESKGMTSRHEADEPRRMEKDDYSVQFTAILHKRWIPTQNTLLQILIVSILSKTVVDWY